MTENEKVAFEHLCTSVSGYVSITHNIRRFRDGIISEVYQAYADESIIISDDCPTPMEAVDELLKLMNE